MRKTLGKLIEKHLASKIYSGYYLDDRKWDKDTFEDDVRPIMKAVMESDMDTSEFTAKKMFDMALSVTKSKFYHKENYTSTRYYRYSRRRYYRRRVFACGIVSICPAPCK